MNPKDSLVSVLIVCIDKLAQIVKESYDKMERSKLCVPAGLVVFGWYDRVCATFS